MTTGRAHEKDIQPTATRGEGRTGARAPRAGKRGPPHLAGPTLVVALAALPAN